MGLLNTSLHDQRLHVEEEHVSLGVLGVGAEPVDDEGESLGLLPDLVALSLRTVHVGHAALGRQLHRRQVPGWQFNNIKKIERIIV